MLIDDEYLNKTFKEQRNKSDLYRYFSLDYYHCGGASRLFYELDPKADFGINRYVDSAVTIIGIKGMLKVTLYDDFNKIIDECMLNPLNGIYGYHIDEGVWFSFKSMAPHTVIFLIRENKRAPQSYDGFLA